MKPPLKEKARRGAIGLVILAALASAGGFAWTWWMDARFEVRTDNAYVRGDVTAIAPEVEGRVVAVLVDDNQIVEAGAILVRIDDADFRAQADRARAAVAAVAAAADNLDRRTQFQLAVIREADAAVEAARADVDLAQSNLARSRQLLAQGWTPQSNHDAASAAAQRAAATLTRAEAAGAAAREQLAVIESEAAQIAARRSEAEAALRLAEIALADTVIHSPVAGVVGNRHVQPGEYVRPGASLLSIVPLRDVWVVANFKETQIAHMRVGQTAHITVDGFPGVEIRGAIDSLAPASGAAFSLLPPDNATGNFIRIVQRVPVKIRLNADHPLVGRLVPGLSAEVAIDLPASVGPGPIAEGNAPQVAVQIYR
ncbi:HlyD family secretion protein [Inquilinus sp. CAU 1745]|uniref:HlyD family secretion protein n=1 Tax=Inquilinus sp. CAU 1745 TaxID=3140369 RepID=UPI00325B06FB